MARNRGKKKAKSKKKAAKSAKSNKQRQESHPVASSQHIARDEQQTCHSAMAPNEKPEATLRGGDASLTVFPGRKLTFNPSMINAHDEGDQDVTLLDVSPGKAGEERNPLFDEVLPVENRGIDIFKVAAAPEHLKIEEAATDAKGQRSLEDVIAENPDTKLSNLDGETLTFAGRAVRQVALEATHEFLQSCIPEADQQKVWDQISGQRKAGSLTKCSITVPDGTMDLKNGVRSTSDLIGNCIGVLSLNAPVKDQKTLKLSLGRAVTLCDAVGDEKRRQALEKAAYELNWLMLGLDCKTMELYRGANRQLDRINLDYPVVTGPSGVSGAGVCDERKAEERNILQSMKWAHEGSKEPFRVRFIETLQSLLAL